MRVELFHRHIRILGPEGIDLGLIEAEFLSPFASGPSFSLEEEEKLRKLEENCGHPLRRVVRKLCLERQPNGQLFCSLAKEENAFEAREAFSLPGMPWKLTFQALSAKAISSAH